MIVEYSRIPTDPMLNMKKGRKKNTITAMTNINEYISAVIPYSDSEDEQEDEYELEDDQENEQGYEEEDN